MPGRDFSYHEQKETDYTLQLLTELPPYAKDYFRAAEQKTSAKTRISYAYDLQVFFRFLIDKNPALSGRDMNEITLKDVDLLTGSDIEEYQEYLKYYESGNGEQRNGASSIARKMSSLRSFLDYFYKKELLTKNVVMQVDMPKLHEKAIVRLEPDEVAIMLDNIETYENQFTGKTFLIEKRLDDTLFTISIFSPIKCQTIIYWFVSSIKS